MNALTLWDNLLRRFPALKCIENPVVMRDLRAQMRGARSYWYIGGYLLLLGILAVAGYAQATGQSLNPAQWDESRGRNIVDAQANLEGFYWFIFGTLALLITVIAPALTAASVVGERQRQSFDLLVTTPLTAGQLLIGKLLSSIAFLGLLLLLSLPATALCILLGGATIGDVFRIYLLLAVDSIVLSAIGLYFSCAVRVPLLATVWTYMAVAGFLIVTYCMSANTFQNPLQLLPILSVAWLNPITAIRPVMDSEGNSLILLFRLVVFLGIAGLVVRLLLAAATYRLGLFGAQSGVSLRRLSLLLTAILVGFVSNSFAQMTYGNWLISFLSLILLIFVTALPFLPGLFVPATEEDAPPGTTSETARDPKRHRLFDIRRLFHPQHSGALPWYIAFVVTAMLSILAGVLPYPARFAEVATLVLAGGFYLLGIGGVTWSLSRLAGSLISELSPARATAFALFVCVLGLPTLLFTLQTGDWKANPLVSLWLLSPFLYVSGNFTSDTPWQIIESLLRCGTLAFSFTTVIFLIMQSLRTSETPVVRNVKVT